MVALTEEMCRLVREQKLGFVASVDAAGHPNLSPKGTLTVLDPDHFLFADLASPQTVENLRLRPAVEVNVVDPFSRKGYRFRGTAEILAPAAEGGRYLELFRRLGLTDPERRIRHVVKIRVDRALPLTSPTYDSGISEAEVRARWVAYYARLHAGETDLPDPA